MHHFPRKSPTFASADAVEEAFYDALQRGDLKGLMSLWADDEDVICVHPGQPRLVGVEAVFESWKGIFEHRGGIPVRPTEYKVFQSATLAVHNVIEEVMSGQGQKTIHCSAVNVYIKGGTGWRLLSHQASIGGSQELTANSVGVSLH